MQNRTKYEEFLNKIDVLQELDTYERNKLCDCLKIQNYPTDSYIIRQGERGDTFYMIMKGEGEATKKNAETGEEEVVYQYKENMYFGELSLLRDEPRAASIRTTVSPNLFYEI
jgi:cAMP-dependent protein kinase regulator